MVHDAAADGYQQQADTYEKARPGYHLDLVSRFVDQFGAGDVVEVGAGTGIFTAQLVDAGVSPVAVEPVAEMRATLMAKLPSIQAIDGTAETTCLPDNCADTVVVAQAFHWFDHGPALNEIKRILRPDGYLVCAWNVRDQTVDWVRGYTEIMDRHAGDAPRAATMKWRRAIEADPTLTLVDDWSIPNPQRTTPEGVVARALSTSFIGALPANTQAEVLDEVRRLVEPLGQTFDNPYVSELQAWTLN